MDSDDADDDRDAQLMRQLAYARGRPDGALRADLIITELLARHEPNIRRIVAYRTSLPRSSKADIDDLVNTVMIGVAKALEGVVDPDVPFAAIVAKNIRWDVIDWWRTREHRTKEIPSEDIVLPDGDPDIVLPSLADEAKRLRELIGSLPEREREILTQRMLFGLSPERIAEIHGMSRGAVDVATHRALKKLRADERVLAARDKLRVRDSAGRPERKA